MFTTNQGSILTLLGWQWRHVALFTTTATLVTVAHRYLGWRWLTLPSVPVAVVGGALGIFVSFRTNSAYARWWEGRQLWGRLINASRQFASQVLAYLPEDSSAPSHASNTDGPRPSALQRALVRRQAAYTHVLRCTLREQDPVADPRVTELLDEPERTALARESNPAHAVLHAQYRALGRAANEGVLSGDRLRVMDGSLSVLLDAQGGCERIKKTPLPRGYSYIAELILRAFGVLFPIATVDTMGWATIPISVLVCMSFALISEVGRVLEDPFNMFWNALPLSALSTTIEVNLRQRLGDADLPAVPKADKRGILM